MIIEDGFRDLTADDLGVGVEEAARERRGSSRPDDALLPPDDPRLLEVERLIDRFGGLILSGPPGTGKSWFAGQLAHHLTQGDNDRRTDVQFHASYQFEDLMEGFRPRNDAGGFEYAEGVFLRLARRAADHPTQLHVLVIDELSRADVGRVFGEALTYIERSKRGMPFTLPSGKEATVPANFFILATMNPADRGVDEVDAAFGRRFATKEMLPDVASLEAILDRNEFEKGDLRTALMVWFRRVNSLAKTVPEVAVGHAYFNDAVDESSLRDIWNYQLKHHVSRALEFDSLNRDKVMADWYNVVSEHPAADFVDADDSSE